MTCHSAGRLDILRAIILSSLMVAASESVRGGGKIRHRRRTESMWGMGGGGGATDANCERRQFSYGFWAQIGYGSLWIANSCVDWTYCQIPGRRGVRSASRIGTKPANSASHFIQFHCAPKDGNYMQIQLKNAVARA